MNYLGLINAVLVRLREPVVTANNYESNPFFMMIGSCVNDAKDFVENSWDWTALRGVESVNLLAGENTLLIPNSQNNQFQITSVLNATTGSFLKEMTQDKYKSIYANNLTSPVGQNSPSYWATYLQYWNDANDEDTLNGNNQIIFDAPSNSTYQIDISYSKRQNPLVSYQTRIKVPALPVYTLATALASRERGEVGGAPTSELFALADKTLSNAIAIDSAKHSEELIWYVPSDMTNTNVRG